MYKDPPFAYENTNKLWLCSAIDQYKHNGKTLTKTHPLLMKTLTNYDSAMSLTNTSMMGS